jgi:hypothetical protein
MQPVNELIPKDKFDIATAEKLVTFSYEDIKPIIPNLLEWIQDMNWPVAGPVSNYLQGIASYITSDIIKILRGNDPTWKYWCLIVFGMSDYVDPLLLEEIKRLRMYASQMDIEEGVVEVATEVINLNGA